jgi:hypothetical protein
MSHRAATVSLACIVGFVGTAFVLHVVRGELDWWRAPLSFYLDGSYGTVLQAAYVGLALSLALTGMLFRQALRPEARSTLAPWLFGTAAIALVTTAMAHAGTPGSTEAILHSTAAKITFLTVTFAAMLQSWHLRFDPAWRHRFVVAFALALAGFAALWIHVLFRDWPRGLTQRIAIALILAWLTLAACWLRAHARAHSSLSSR